jgi:hypothetical protein
LCLRYWKTSCYQSEQRSDGFRCINVSVYSGCADVESEMAPGYQDNAVVLRLILRCRHRAISVNCCRYRVIEMQQRSGVILIRAGEESCSVARGGGGAKSKGSCRQLVSLLLCLSLNHNKAQTQIAPMAGLADEHLTGRLLLLNFSLQQTEC